MGKLSSRASSSITHAGGAHQIYALWFHKIPLSDERWRLTANLRPSIALTEAIPSGCRFESQRRSLQIHVSNLHRNQHEQKNTATLQTPAPSLVDAPVNHSEQVPTYLLGAPRVRASREFSDSPALRLCGKPILGIGNASRKRNLGKFRTTIIKRTVLDTDDDDKDQCPPLDDLSDETPRSILVHPSRTRKVMKYLSVPSPFESLALTDVLQVAPMLDSPDNRNNLLFRRDTTERIIAMQLEGVRCHHSMYWPPSVFISTRTARICLPQATICCVLHLLCILL